MSITAMVTLLRCVSPSSCPIRFHPFLHDIRILALPVRYAPAVDLPPRPILLHLRPFDGQIRRAEDALAQIIKAVAEMECALEGLGLLI